MRRSPWLTILGAAKADVLIRVVSGNGSGEAIDIKSSDDAEFDCFILLLAIAAGAQTTITGRGTLAGPMTAMSSLSTSPILPTSNSNRCVGMDRVWLGPRYDGPAELPRMGYYSALSATPSLGAVTTVAAGNYADLKTKGLAANCGDTIVIPARSGAAQAQYVADQIVPAQTCDAAHYIPIRSDQLNSCRRKGHASRQRTRGIVTGPSRLRDPTTRAGGVSQRQGEQPCRRL